LYFEQKVKMSSNPQQQQQSSSTMSSPPSPLVWFLLLDSATGLPYKKTTADYVSRTRGSVIAQFRDAVKKKYKDEDSTIITGIASSQLLVYKNKATFDKRNAAVDEGKEEPLKSSCLLDGLGITEEDALIVVVPSSRMPSREQSTDELFDAGSTTFLSEEEYHPRKIQRMEISDLTTQLKSFANAQFVEGCIQSQDQAFLPYPQDEIKKVYVRKCYQDVFHLLIQRINLNVKSFAISGTPGIGKSLFFVYILYRLMDDFRTKNLSLKPNRIVYQMGSTYECFDLQQQLVTRTTKLDAEGLVREQDTFYVIDGRTSEPLVSSCVVLFISSPRSEWYKAFVKQKMAKEWYFPVWTLDELQTCQRHCYPDLPSETLQERHRICGGVARFVFHKDYSIPVPKKMRSALNDVDAVRGVKYVGEATDIFPTSHTLLQILVGDDEFGNAYQFTDLDVASEYVGEQLWIRHSAQMITNLQVMFGGSPNEISRHLFEIYGHRVFSAGGRTIKCRCLESGTVTEITLDALHSQRITFGKDAIPTAEDLSGNYYEPTDDDTFPAIDSLSPQGMFQFTVAAEHPIRGVQILRRLCELYDEPKLYFVVPPHRFAAFKKQSFKAKTGTNNVAEIVDLKQYVLELPVTQYTC
jgi:hypothetical protein